MLGKISWKADREPDNASSLQQCRHEPKMVRRLCEQVARGEHAIIGVMLDSSLEDDGCLGWKETECLLQHLAAAVRDRRSDKRGN